MNINEYGLLLMNSISNSNLQKSINSAINLLLADNARIYTIGNGGSATLAEHFAQDLTKSCFIPAIFLGNISSVTAYGNDLTFNRIFSDQLRVYFKEGDILICFSSSGNSKNILEACKQAKLMGGKIISFTGFSGGRLKEMSDINIYVPVDNYGIVEAAHSLIFHFIVNRIDSNGNS
jgi:D-sedoheptulose 7-phosphate isomerase